MTSLTFPIDARDLGVALRAIAANSGGMMAALLHRPGEGIAEPS
jgi:hypothetical protein